MTLVKICGLRTEDAAIVAAGAGADYLGFIFAPSKRQVTAGEVAHIRASVRGAGFSTPLVGVFVDPDPDALLDVVGESGLDVVQLSGDESPAVFDGFPFPIIKAVPAGADDTVESVMESIQAWSFAVHHLVDARVAGARGGTGKLANWAVATDVAARVPILLAGGLDPGNVREAIANVRPAGVDVASGVEVDGVKDPDAIRRFVGNARSSTD